MSARSLRFLAILAGVTAVAVATQAGSRLALTAAGLLCIGLALLVMRSDKLRRSGRGRR